MARAAVSNVSQRDWYAQFGRIRQHGHAGGCGHQLAQECQPLRHQFINEIIDARRVATRSGEAGDEAEPDRVFADGEDNGDRRGCRLGRERRRGTSSRGDHGDLAANQFGGQCRQPIELTLRPAVFDRHVLALDIASFAEALSE